MSKEQPGQPPFDTREFSLDEEIELTEGGWSIFELPYTSLVRAARDTTSYARGLTLNRDHSAIRHGINPVFELPAHAFIAMNPKALKELSEADAPLETAPGAYVPTFAEFGFAFRHYLPIAGEPEFLIPLGSTFRTGDVSADGFCAVLTFAQFDREINRADFELTVERASRCRKPQLYARLPQGATQ
jgi:hypothetical protein